MEKIITKKRIGLLGGISHKSTIEYYDMILKKYFERFGDYYYPELIIYSLDFQRFTDYEDKNELEKYLAYITFGITNLKKFKKCRCRNTCYDR
jgi:aspartate racemase